MPRMARSEPDAPPGESFVKYWFGDTYIERIAACSGIPLPFNRHYVLIIATAATVSVMFVHSL